VINFAAVSKAKIQSSCEWDCENKTLFLFWDICRLVKSTILRTFIENGWFSLVSDVVREKHSGIKISHLINRCWYFGCALH